MDNSKLIESLSPNEIRILPYLKENISDISKKSSLDRTSVLRALEFLDKKGVVNISYKKKKIIEVGVNGALYLNKGLPERRLLNVLREKRILLLEVAQKQGDLSDDEFKASIGVLRRKKMIELKNGKIIFISNNEEISKKSTEELFLEVLPLEYDSLSSEQLTTFKELNNRKGLLYLREDKNLELSITNLGNELMKLNLKPDILIEQITPEILKKESSWKGKKFRRYDLTSSIPKIYGGKRHFVNQSADHARRLWTDMGFKEMSGDMLISSFWNFDALFTAQDHPVREMQDTFFVNKDLNLPDKKLVNSVKESHEKGVDGSRGWEYTWNEKDAKKAVLRTHTTCLSAQTLSKLKKEDLPSKFFALGKCFRNETVDWSHGFEFNQTEGIVVDKNANFRHLLGYLKQFFRKMGFEKIRFRPAYFPYTEPSVEIDFYNEERKVWLELGGAGIFRPEVVIPLLGENIPVLAWGPGFDRILMDYYEIKDIRELYKNNITQLRNIKSWMKT